MSGCALNIPNELSGLIAEIGGKHVYLYGLGVFGVAIASWLKKMGVTVEGIFDTNNANSSFCDVPLFDPNDIKKRITFDSCVVVTTSNPRSTHEVESHLIYSGLKKGKSYYLFPDQMYISIDVVSLCGLRCKSCSVGNCEKDLFPSHNRNMDCDLFEMLVKHIKQEYPSTLCLYLYAYGDPILHPELERIIRIAHDNGFLVVLSTSLSYDIDLLTLVNSNPDCLKISMSGYYNDVYLSTHNGGDSRLVLSNLYKLRYYLDRTGMDFPVVIGYHMYTNNTGDDYHRVKDLCIELDFVFRPVSAKYDRLLKATGISKYSETDISFVKEMYSNPDEIMNPVHYSDSKYCYYWDSHVSFDSSGCFTLCCSVFGKPGEINKKFDELSFDDYKKIRTNSEICKCCLSIHDGQYE